MAQNTTSVAMVPAGGCQKGLRKSIKHEVQRPGRNSYSTVKEHLWQLEHQNQVEIISFQTWVYLTRSHQQSLRIEPQREAIATEVPTTVLLYITMKSGTYMRL